MTIQKFHAGDLIQIDNKMPRHMFHFKAGVKAIVQYSYYDVYGGDDDQKKSYSLQFEDGDSSSWYEEDQLTLIASQQTTLLEEWRER